MQVSSYAGFAVVEMMALGSASPLLEDAFCLSTSEHRTFGPAVGRNALHEHVFILRSSGGRFAIP